MLPRKVNKGRAHRSVEAAPHIVLRLVRFAALCHSQPSPLTSSRFKPSLFRMACDYIVVLPLITGTTSVSTGFALPLAPFDTSSWTINLQQPRFNSSSGGTVSVTLYWSGSQPFDTPSHHIQVLFGTSNSSWDATTPLEYDLKKPEDGSSPVYSAQWSAPAYSYDGYISVQAKVKDEALSKLSEVFYRES